MAASTSVYPAFGVSKLRTQLGKRWSDLVDTISRLPVSDPHVMALSLTLRRIQRASSHKDNVCRDPLCAVCAAEITMSFHGTEQDLLDLYYHHLGEIHATLRTMRKPHQAAAIASAA